ncbi:YcfL family protein, partial [Escherichia sp. HC-CC]
TLYNERQEPVTVHYRFYWYDARGLEMHPLERPRSVSIPAHSAVTLYGSANFLGAHKVRLYLYL